MNKVIPIPRSLMAVVALAAAVLLMPQGAQGQGSPIGELQDTLGPVPGPSEPDIQEQIDELKQMLCALVSGRK